MGKALTVKGQDMRILVFDRAVPYPACGGGSHIDLYMC